jgi:hypothetical protein
MDTPFNPIDEIPPDDEETEQAKLERTLREYRKAVEEEFEQDKAYTEGKATPAQIRKRTREILTQAIPGAVASMHYLSQHAKAETVRKSASQFIIEMALGKEAAASGLVGDPMEILLNQLTDAGVSDAD